MRTSQISLQKSPIGAKPLSHFQPNTLAEVAQNISQEDPDFMILSLSLGKHELQELATELGNPEDLEYVQDFNTIRTQFVKLAKVSFTLLPAIEQAGDMFEEYMVCKEKEQKYDQMITEIERIENENEGLKQRVQELEQHLIDEGGIVAEEIIAIRSREASQRGINQLIQHQMTQQFEKRKLTDLDTQNLNVPAMLGSGIGSGKLSNQQLYSPGNLLMFKRRFDFDNLNNANTENSEAAELEVKELKEQIVQLQQKIDTYKANAKRQDEKQKEDLALIEDQYQQLRNLEEEFQTRKTEKEQLLIQLKDHSNMIGILEESKQRLEDDIYHLNTNLNAANKEIKDWKEKHTKLQDYAHQLGLDRASKGQLLEEAVNKAQEFEACIRQFASVQEQLLQTKTKQKESVDVAKVMSAFKEVRSRDVFNKGKNIFARIANDRRHVDIVVVQDSNGEVVFEQRVPLSFQNTDESHMINQSMYSSRRKTQAIKRPGLHLNPSDQSYINRQQNQQDEVDHSMVLMQLNQRSNLISPAASQKKQFFKFQNNVALGPRNDTTMYEERSEGGLSIEEDENDERQDDSGFNNRHEDEIPQDIEASYMGGERRLTYLNRDQMHMAQEMMLDRTMYFEQFNHDQSMRFHRAQVPKIQEEDSEEVVLVKPQKKQPTISVAIDAQKVETVTPDEDKYKESATQTSFQMTPENNDNSLDPSLQNHKRRNLQLANIQGSIKDPQVEECCVIF